jgi:hypothetical protein
LFQVAFYGMLRPKQTVWLRAKDCLFQLTSAGVLRLVLAIVDSKNRRAFGLSHFVVIKRQSAIRWVSWLGAGVHHKMNLWPSDRTNLLCWFVVR